MSQKLRSQLLCNQIREWHWAKQRKCLHPFSESCVSWNYPASYVLMRCIYHIRAVLDDRAMLLTSRWNGSKAHRVDQADIVPLCSPLLIWKDVHQWAAEHNPQGFLLIYSSALRPWILSVFCWDPMNCFSCRGPTAYLHLACPHADALSNVSSTQHKEIRMLLLLFRHKANWCAVELIYFSSGRPALTFSTDTFNACRRIVPLYACYIALLSVIPSTS